MEQIDAATLAYWRIRPDKADILALISLVESLRDEIDELRSQLEEDEEEVPVEVEQEEDR